MCKVSGCVVLLFLLGVFGCGGGEHVSADHRVEGHAGEGGSDGRGTFEAGSNMGGDSADAPDTTAEPPEPPPPADEGDPCILSADCAKGLHCDLGECVQRCNTDRSCPAAQICSARGRCVSPDEHDRDPPPVAEHSGSVQVEPRTAELTELDENLSLRLTTDASEPVRYRIELKAPFLTLQGEERGEFEESTTLRFSVSPAGLTGTITSGTILIHTDLGDVVATPSIRVGLSGTYRGVLRYDSGSTPLGDVGVAIDMHDDGGDVLVRIDPEHSLLFPVSASGAAAGRGIFTFSEGLSVTVSQLLDVDYGGTRNHFRRPIGRRISFQLAPAGQGRLEGTFKETVHGLLARPVQLSGHVYLEPRDLGRSVDLSVPADPAMPAASSQMFPQTEIFQEWNDEQCLTPCPFGSLECFAQSVDSVYYQLDRTLARERQSADPLNDIAEACETEMMDVNNAHTGGSVCARVPVVACALREVAHLALADRSSAQPILTASQVTLAGRSFPRILARTLAPALLVAQNHVVEGLKESFVSGASAQGSRLQKARAALDAPLTWVLAPGILEWLASLSAQDAAGEMGLDDGTRINFPAGRALARALYVLATLDAEEGRLEAASVLGTDTKKIERAQQNGLLGFLEAVTLSSVLANWGSPPNIGNEFLGSLTLSDRGFTALQEGALVFGVPEGQVPMMFDPTEPESTNFKQILKVWAQPALDQFESDEAIFTAASREFEQTAKQLADELEAVRKSFDDQLQAICGSEFDVNRVRGDADFAQCGGNGTGEIGELTLDIQQAFLGQQLAYARLQSMHKGIAIDQQRLADTQGVHRDTLRFIDQQGNELEALVVAEGQINVAQKALEIASNSQFWNGGAPAAMAMGAAFLEGLRTSINVQRQRLETAQQMRAVADVAKVELINGMAEIQKQLIDMAELELEIEQATLGIAQADLRRRNALDRARQLVRERVRSLARVSASPLTDPLYRVLESRLALQAVHSRATAQRWLYRAARALEYEINTPLGEALDRAILGAYNQEQVERLNNCLLNVFNEHAAEFGAPQEFTTTVSVRKMLGIVGPRVDEVTGDELDEGELFRRAVLRNETIDAAGNLTITFVTNLQPGNELWSANVCDDTIASVQAQIVGDFQGDNEAEVHVALEGGSVMRRCDSDELINWHIDSSDVAVIQAGVNTFGDVRPNTSLFGQSVARASWTIVIPSGISSPANSELDLEHIEDIVLKITHRALPKQSRAVPIDVSCLGRVGAGG